jgi:hypothetical protein
MTDNVDLVKVFQAVAKNLAQNRDVLNQADSYNHDHGDNIVQVFEMVTKAVKTKKGADVSDQLAYASDYLSKRAKSGSGQAYAQGLAQAANQFKGQQLTSNNAMMLISALLGGGQSQAQTPASAESPVADLLGTFLGGGQAQAQAPAGAESPVADLLGALLGSENQPQNQPSQQAPDTSQLLSMGLNIGMNFLQAKQQGRSNMEALVQAIVAGSQMGQTPHRAQSATIIANTLMSLLVGGTK